MRAACAQTKKKSADFEKNNSGYHVGSEAPGGARSDGSLKIINPLITYNTTQFKKSKQIENIVAFSSILLSTFYIS
jgi:hypothetical protein